jgi:very-short-patch-repair endonuclease
VPRTSVFDVKALAAVLARQHRAVSREQALACGMSPAAIRYRCREAGPWQVLVPGVYLAHTGAPTDDQREMAGPALWRPTRRPHWPGGRPPPRCPDGTADAVDVLVPPTTGKRDARFVRLHRTARMPERVCVAGAVSYTLPSRAVADAARDLADIGRIRALVADSMQRGICAVPWLAEELAAGPVRGSARLRRVLAEVADGVRSAAEADLHTAIRRGRLPSPMFNPRLFIGHTFIGVPDCWWPDAGVAAEADSREWHLSPEDWERTLARHARLSSYGIIVLHFTPGQVRDQQQQVISRIRAALAAGRSRPLPPIRTLSAA